MTITTMSVMMTVLAAAVLTMLVIGEDECDRRDDEDAVELTNELTNELATELATELAD